MNSNCSKNKYAFEDVVNKSNPLQYKDGLQAIKADEGKERISAKDSRKILGSVNIDDDCRGEFPGDNRWDYAIGYERNANIFVYFVEVHSAHTSEVGVLRKKLDWIKQFLNSNLRKSLNKLPREFHWVASKSYKIPKNTPQYRLLSLLNGKRQLIGPTKKLILE